MTAIYNEINRGDKEDQLSTGNALWVHKDYEFLQDYLTTVESYYGGKAANVDFVGETEKTRQTINSFIEEQTGVHVWVSKEIWAIPLSLGWVHNIRHFFIQVLCFNLTIDFK